MRDANLISENSWVRGSLCTARLALWGKPNAKRHFKQVGATPKDNQGHFDPSCELKVGQRLQSAVASPSGEHGQPPFCCFKSLIVCPTPKKNIRLKSNFTKKITNHLTRNLIIETRSSTQREN